MSLWVHPILMMLGAWLVTSPVTFGYGSGAMMWSDVISGVLVIIFAVLSLRHRGAWASWANSVVGAWLIFAPLVFWAPSSAAYLNDTLVGALVIAFAILIPHGMPMEGPDVPPGWTYNPSSWLQRTPVIGLGLIGFLGARYMAAYQLGYIDNAWDPFFNDGTFRVLTLCLVTAVVMLVMIPLTVDEVVAMGQFLVKSYHDGKPFWRTFWLGGNLAEGGEETPPRDFGSPPREAFPAMVCGVSASWPLLLSAALGVWLMFAPFVLGSRGAAMDGDHLVGALVVTFAMIALAEVVRTLRFINVLFGTWLVAAPWLLAGATLVSTWSDMIVGAALIIMSLPRGTVRQRYGDWDRYVR